MKVIMFALLLASTSTSAFAQLKPVHPSYVAIGLFEVGDAVYEYLDKGKGQNCFMLSDLSALGAFYTKNGVQLSRDLFFRNRQGSAIEINLYQDVEKNLVVVENALPFRSNTLHIQYDEMNENIKSVTFKIDADSSKEININCLPNLR